MRLLSISLQRQPLAKNHFLSNSDAEKRLFIVFPSSNHRIAAFPAGIMQFPLLVSAAPRYVNYAMFGAVVGHEVSHAFDDQGEWQSSTTAFTSFPLLPQDVTTTSWAIYAIGGTRKPPRTSLIRHNASWSFITTLRCVGLGNEAGKYGLIQVPHTNGMRLNGRKSLGENIADNAGVKTALQVRCECGEEVEKSFVE